MTTPGPARATGTGISQLPTAALAATPVPYTPRFGPAIDNYAPSDPQATCDPTEKAGPVALRAMLNKTYDLNRTGNLSRDCNLGDTSEHHKEGRAHEDAPIGGRHSAAADRGVSGDVRSSVSGWRGGRRHGCGCPTLPGRG